MKIDKQKLEQKIKEGKSSHDIAMTYDDKNIGHNTGTVFVQKTF